MATDIEAAPTAQKTGSLRKQTRRFRTVAYGFMIVYTLVTLFPFYILFIRTFVSTKDSTELHLWIPRGEDLSMDAEIGNLAVNYNIDIKKLKDELGIKGYLNPRQSLAVIAEKNNIPIERFERYFANFGTFNGWITLLGRAEYWKALGRTAVTTIIGIALLCLLSMLTGYGLAGLRRRDQMVVYNVYLLQMVIPTVLIIIPQFLLIQTLIGLVPGSDKPGMARSIAQLGTLVLIFIKGGALSTMVFTTSINQIPAGAGRIGAARRRQPDGLLLGRPRTADEGADRHRLGDHAAGVLELLLRAVCLPGRGQRHRPAADRGVWRHLHDQFPDHLHRRLCLGDAAAHRLSVAAQAVHPQRDGRRDQGVGSRRLS